MQGTDPQGTRYEVTGNGLPIILVHGLGLNHAMWRWVTPALARNYCVVSYDLIGHGDSYRKAADLSMDDFVAQLVNLSDHLGLTRYAVIGFSLGGLIAEAFALAYPARTAALGVLHSAYDRNQEERAAIRARVQLARTAGPAATIGPALQRWFTAAFAERSPDTLEQVRAWVTANDPASFAAAYHVLAEADADLADAIGAIRCPTLVMTGDEDFGNSPEMARKAAGKVPGADCVILPGLRHMALAEDPTAVLQALLPFLTRTYHHLPA
jgi:pimeloyl-ACP methyl ester carboxylesterase